MNNRFLSHFCGGLIVLASATFSNAYAAPTTNYQLLTTMAVPTSSVNVQPGGAFTSFDIGFFDTATQLYFIADRSNASVDIFSGLTNSFVGRAPGFTGQAATTSRSGADGVVVVDNGSTHTLFAGDGNSTLKMFNVTNPAAPVLMQSINTGGAFRVDEMAYSPTANLVLVANNADSPAFGTLVNASTGAIVRANITIPGQAASGGLEQPIWNPATGTFFISVPTFNGTDAGGVAEIRTDGTVGRLYNFSAMGISACSPAGIALGGSGNLLVGCGDATSQTVLLNPTGTGSIVATFAQIRGSDELAYDPTLGDFFITGVNASGARVFDVLSDLTDTILQSIALPNVNAHSIAVDPVTGDVFVPLEGSTSAGADALCPVGCIAVFSSVPEPATLALLAPSLLFIVWGRRRRSNNARR
jgi:hypothetical protein